MDAPFDYSYESNISLCGFLPIHVTAQNAGIILTHEPRQVLFEAFELSPTNEAAVDTVGRLRRCLPTASVSIHWKYFNDPEFRSALAETIAKMSHQELAEAKPKVQKQGESHIEERDTTNPFLVTDFMITVLQTVGSLVNPSQIWKNTREEVLWQNARLPWRRPPIWLLVRAALQLHFSRLFPQQELYKDFMVFFLSDVLELAWEKELSSDILYCVSAKISKRLVKLSEKTHRPWLQAVNQTLQRTKNLLTQRWDFIKQTAEAPLNLTSLLTTLWGREDSEAYPELDQFVWDINLRQRKPALTQFRAPWVSPCFAWGTLPILTDNFSDSGPFHLLAFEAWVRDSLDLWVEHCRDMEDVCNHLYLTAKAYHVLGQKAYEGCPASLSVMMLTTLEIWVACDRLACQKHGLLMEYDPEIPPGLLQSLILCSRNHLDRLCRVEEYLKSRHNRARPQLPSVISSFGQKKSFSVRFYAISAEHQSLQCQIEAQARMQREQKRAEFLRQKEHYNSLDLQARRLNCEYYAHMDWSTGLSTRSHSRSCHRCRLRNQAENLTIDVHEWPLSHHKLQAQSTIFELKVPPNFNAWRNLTVFLIHDVLQSAYTKHGREQIVGRLSTYLDAYYNDTPRRLQLVSTTKSNCRTHRRGKSIITAIEEDILVANGLRYEYYDSDKGCFVSNSSMTDSIPQILMFKLSGLNQGLQSFIFRPAWQPNGLSPNHVLSEQHSCSNRLSLEEFKSMATQPAGNRIQWQNLLVQLFDPTLDFNKPDTLQMLLQITCQVGPPLDGSVYRVGHQLLREEEFSDRLLEGLSLSVVRIEKNWESFVSLHGLIVISIKALHLSMTDALAARYRLLLVRCRSVAVAWIQVLHEKSSRIEDDEQRETFLFIMLRIALVCVASFQVDQIHLEAILSDQGQVETLLESSILANSLSTIAGRPSDPIHIGLEKQGKRTLYESHNILRRRLVNSRSCGLNSAVRRFLPFHAIDSLWEQLSETEYHWVESKKRANSGEVIAAIQLNLLTAELLVNGLPPSRLPDAYQNHPILRPLFGKNMIEVTATDVPGMQFCTTKTHHGHVVYLGLDGQANRPDLFLMARKETHKQELISSRVFENILPEFFVSSFLHWYDDRDIEFRPKDSPWTTSLLNWRLHKVGLRWVLRREGQVLLPSISPIAQCLHCVFQPLEQHDHIHLVVSDADSTLQIGLPRLRLDFLLQSGSPQLFCKQFRGMYVAEDQTIGSLVGLRSKLVLENSLGHRKVLIPSGHIQHFGASPHVKVVVEYGSSSRILAFDIDLRLGRLVDNGSLTSKLFVAYLHALTSFCMPDELTRRTGTEQCLFILNSAAIRSYPLLSIEDYNLLHSIARLSPGRAYYPVNARVMESVKWDDRLSPLSQHARFNTVVESIFQAVASTGFLYGAAFVRPPTLDHISRRLDERHQIRMSTFNVDGYGAECHTTDHDATYDEQETPNRRTALSRRSKKAFVVALTAVERRESLHSSLAQGLQGVLWDLLCNPNGTPGPSVPLLINDIGYDSRWISDTETVLSEYWCRFHRAFSQPHHGTDTYRFRLMFCLSAMAYAETCCFDAIQVLTAYANISHMARINVPDVPKFQTCEGHCFDDYSLRNIVNSHLIPFINCPEASLSSNLYESEWELHEWRYRLFESRQSEAVGDFLACLRPQWPCKTPTRPINPSFRTYLSIKKVMKEIVATWERWYENHRLFNYLATVIEALQLVDVRPIVAPTHAPQRPIRTFVAHRPVHISEGNLFTHTPPSLDDASYSKLDLLDHEPVHGDPNERLGCLIAFLRRQALREFEQEYLTDLSVSRSQHEIPPHSLIVTKSRLDLWQTLECYLAECLDRNEIIYNHLVNAAVIKTESSPAAVDDSTLSGTYIASNYMGPRISPSFFLVQLTQARWKLRSQAWRKLIVTYARSLTMVQRAARMLDRWKDSTELLKELSNPGHTNWDPMEYPESLLMEVEGDFLIRPVQEQIAAHMRLPPGNLNAAMQLNMGEGKSAVIIPIVAVHLADGEKLPRIIVAKPQAKELFRMLVSKLGGLVNHRIYHLPFSRSLKLTLLEATAILQVIEECAQNGGVLLVQPEHLLSFELMAIESQLISQREVGQVLLDIQHYFNIHSRDLVDESDENFSVKFELIYTMGTQRPIELGVERWSMIQHVLGLIQRLAYKLQRELPESMQVSPYVAGHFPRTRILREDAEERLLGMIAAEICNIGLPGFPIMRQPPKIREAVRKYILHDLPELSLVEAVETESGFFSPATAGRLLLLRGLLARGVLAFALRQKRWRVNYGLDAHRNPQTRLAVPYRAKDNPTARSEFSHPDVVILLTCLSYYYGGLTDENLFATFDHLLRADQAEVQYQDWLIDAPTLPRSFRSLAGVTLKDRHQAKTDIFPHLRRAKRVIDYFLGHLVFPKEMKEFPLKLSASGWNIGRKKQHPTTGFSGTCDSRVLLPLDMKHLNLPSQRHTNALVLRHVLQPENCVVMMPESARRGQSDAETFLDLVVEMNPPVQVILDVGAQILELTNLQFAEKWLAQVPSHLKKEAVVYFDDHDNLCVLDRHGRTELLQTSPFSDQLDLCLVFLDEAHTRGTDLRLPREYRAAVTLGAGLTKDRLVQGKYRSPVFGHSRP